MKSKKVMEYTRKLTPRQLALVELKMPERPSGPITLTDFIKNYLIPRMDAKKRKVVLLEGKVSDVYGSLIPVNNYRRSAPSHG